METIVDKFLVKHTEKNVVLDILIENTSVFKILNDKEINFKIDGLKALEHEVTLPKEYERLFENIFELCIKLKDQNKHLLSANTATFIYERFAGAWLNFIKNGQHFIAIKLWGELLNYTLKWEEENNKIIHKGTPYGILARTHFSMGDSYSAFNSIYRALNEDIILGEQSPESEYPTKAPSYLTVTLNPSKENFMVDCVLEVRNFIEDFVVKYQSKISPSFTFEIIDTKFLQNRNFEPLNFFFTSTIWSIFEFRRRVNPNLMKNDFALLKNPELFFSLSLIINDLLNYSNSSNDRMGNAIEKYLKNRSWMMKDVNIKGIISNSLPNDIIPDLLKKIHPYHKTNILLQEACLLIAWNIRNFSGHNIIKQDVFAEKFDEILENLLFALFIILEDMRVKILPIK